MRISEQEVETTPTIVIERMKPRCGVAHLRRSAESLTASCNREEAREVASAVHVLHPEAFVTALRARNHEVVLADLPALLGAARLYLALVCAEKTRRTRPQSQRRGLPACGRLS